MNSSQQSPDRIIVGISGASGIVYGIEILKALQDLPVETHLVVTKSAILTLSQETDMNYQSLCQLADHHYQNADIGAAIASGSFRCRGMIIAPCSIRSLSEIASGVTASLLSRAADVVLKERRRLIMMVRETPLHEGHLQSMLSVTRMGGIVMPPVPAFYTRPQSLEDIIRQTAGRALDLLDIDNALVQRWKEDQ